MSPTDAYQLSAKQKVRLSPDLQILWRIDRGLCPTHGQPMSLTVPKISSVDEQDESTFKYRLLSCPIKGCGSVVKAWDWNFQNMAKRPWCIEKV